MNNGAYFDKLRSFILRNSDLEYLEINSDPFSFQDVQTSVQLVVLRKGSKHTHNYAIDLGDLANSPRHRTIFTPNPPFLSEFFIGRTSLWNLGYRLSQVQLSGTLAKEAWRVSKESGTIPLLWAHNITRSNREVVLNQDHPKRPQYIVGATPMVGPAIVVNRITGSVGSGVLRCAQVPEGLEFVGENHLNVIVTRNDVEPTVGFSELADRLNAPHVTEVVHELTGNTGLSATELTILDAHLGMRLQTNLPAWSLNAVVVLPTKEH